MTIFSFCDDGKLCDPAKSKDFFFPVFLLAGFDVLEATTVAAANLNFLAFTLEDDVVEEAAEDVVEVDVEELFLEDRLTMFDKPFLTCFVKLVCLSDTAFKMRTENGALKWL